MKKKKLVELYQKKKTIYTSIDKNIPFILFSVGFGSFNVMTDKWVVYCLFIFVLPIVRSYNNTRKFLIFLPFKVF